MSLSYLILFIIFFVSKDHHTFLGIEATHYPSQVVILRASRALNDTSSNCALYNNPRQRVLDPSRYSYHLKLFLRLTRLHFKISTWISRDDAKRFRYTYRQNNARVNTLIVKVKPYSLFSRKFHFYFSTVNFRYSEEGEIRKTLRRVFIIINTIEIIIID